MATDYPAAVDTSSKLPNPAAGNATNSPSHAGLHDNTNDAIKATQTKVGTGASVPAANTIMFGTGAGSSAWTQLTSAQLAASLTDETGSGAAVFANTPTLVTPKVDTINEATTNNGVTVAGVNMKAGVLTTPSSVSSAAIATGAVGNTQLASGVCVQEVSSVISAVATGTTTIPLDDTIPQITEGDQYLSVVITPKSVTNILQIQVQLFASQSGATNAIAALFQDANVNALAVGQNFNATATAPSPVFITHTMVAGTIGSTTFRVRGGSTAGTMTVNGQSGARLFGASTKSSIVVTEYKA